MPRFVFTLQPLFELRRRQEQQSQRAMALVNQQRVRLEQKLRDQQHIITADKDGLRDHLVGPLNTVELRLHAASAVSGMRTAHRLAVELAGVHKRLAAARAELVEKSRARRAIELLRDRRYAQWKKQQDKAESAAIDELATFAAARQEFS